MEMEEEEEPGQRSGENTRAQREVGKEKGRTGKEDNMGHFYSKAGRNARVTVLLPTPPDRAVSLRESLLPGPP